MEVKHIEYQDRLKIEKLLYENKSFSQIGKAIGKNKSAVYYEVKSKSVGDIYQASVAQKLTKLRRNEANSLRARYTNMDLISEISSQLRRKRSPKDIAMRLKKKFPNKTKMHISHETIYKLVFSFKNDKVFTYLADLYKYLPRKHKKKHIRGHLNPYRTYKRYWRSIHRMREGLKKSFGVWQIDAMHITGGYILVCVETISKKVMSFPVKELTAPACMKALQILLARVENIKAIICDRGSENTQFKEVQRMLNTKVYACDPGSPWQKGLVEGTIRLLRQHFPNDYKYKDLTVKKVYKACALLNTMYRVSLGAETANHVYYRSNSGLT